MSKWMVCFGVLLVALTLAGCAASYVDGDLCVRSTRTPCPPSQTLVLP